VVLGLTRVQVDATKEKASLLAHAHPLDPLRSEEISAAVQAVRLAFGKGHASSSICFIECMVSLLFLPVHTTRRVVLRRGVMNGMCSWRRTLAQTHAATQLEEPHPKDIPMVPLEGEQRPPKPPPQARHARLITYDTVTNMTSEWLVALSVRQAGKGTRTKSFEGKIVSQELLKDVQPALDAWEYEEAERVVKQNAEFQAAMARRGITVRACVCVSVSVSVSVSVCVCVNACMCGWVDSKQTTSNDPVPRTCRW
jgi:hypothetical protein